MYVTCRHIKTNGLRCQSPALKGARFCYYHSKIHTVGAEPHLKYGPLQLPAPEDVAAIQLSIARINDAIINDRIDLKKATTMLYGIQIAAQFIDRGSHSIKTKPSSPQSRLSKATNLPPANTSATRTTIALIALLRRRPMRQAAHRRRISVPRPLFSDHCQQFHRKNGLCNRTVPFNP